MFASLGSYSEGVLVVCQSGLACQRDVKNVFAANMQFTSACFEHDMATVC